MREMMSGGWWARRNRRNRRKGGVGCDTSKYQCREEGGFWRGQKTREHTERTEKRTK